MDVDIFRPLEEIAHIHGDSKPFGNCEALTRLLAVLCYSIIIIIPPQFTPLNPPPGDRQYPTFPISYIHDSNPPVPSQKEPVMAFLVGIVSSPTVPH